MEPILYRKRVIWAERLYTSGRGDYIVYLAKGKLFVVRTPGGDAT